MPRKAPVRQRTSIQRYAAYGGWLGIALLLSSFLYWLYQISIGQNRNVVVNIGLGLGVGLIIYFLVGMGAEIIRGAKSPEGKRAIRSAILVTAVLGVIAVANVLAYRRHIQWDLTGNRRLTLAPMTKRLLKDLGKKIKVTAFYTESAQRRYEATQSRQVRDLLDQYSDASPNFKYQFIDYQREPAKFYDAKMTSAPPVVLFENDTGGREEVKGSTEKDFTGAILKLTRKEQRKIVFTVGHGELDPEASDERGASEVKMVLTDQQHLVSTVDLFGKERKVAPDTSVLVIAGARVEFKPEEAKAVKDYLDQGGHALILLQTGGPNLSPILKDWGVKVGDNVVAQLVDMMGMMAVSRSVRIGKFEAHDINRGLSAVSFPLVRTVEPVSPAPTGITTSSLLKTTADSLTKPLKPGQTSLNLQPTDKDSRGPFSVAVVCEKPIGAKKAKLVVVGGAEWAMNALSQDPTTTNRYLFTNAVNWLADEDALVDIPPKEDTPEQIYPTPEQRARVFYINVLLFPVACLFMAGFTWWKRR